MEIAPNVYMVSIPVPFPLKSVNCFLAKGANGWDLLDTGMVYSDALLAWKKVFVELGIQRNHIGQVFISHAHAEHYGLARWFQERTGAHLFMLDVERRQAAFWEDRVRLPAAMRNLFLRHGMPPMVADQVMASMLQLQRDMGPGPTGVHDLHNGQEVEFGPYRCRVIWTPGHSDGMLFLYTERDGVLFVADHVLPYITPNISLWPGGSPNPLEDSLRSLLEVRDLPANLVLPSHGQCISDLAARVDEIATHHQRRLEAMLLAVGSGRSAYDVARSVFRENLTFHELRFAVSETLAHLEYLVQRLRLNALAR